MSDSMRGLFVIFRGQYSKSKGISYRNIHGTLSHIGGYDPEDLTNPEWYMCYDTETWQCVSSSGDLNRVLQVVQDLIVRHKGSRKRYLKHIKDYTENTSAKSPVMIQLHQEVFKHYGDYYTHLIEEQEDLAYAQLVQERPVNKTKTLLKRSGGIKKNTTQVLETIPPKTEETPTLKKVNTKPKLGIKKIK